MAESPVVMAPLPRLDRVRSVMAALADYAERSGLKAGDKLPTERELTLTLQVGRSTVREVMRQLQILGIADTRVGSGTFLLRPISSATVHLPLSFERSHRRDALLQTLEVRRGLEVEASALAALRRTPADIADMEAKLVIMEREHLTKGTAGREDLAFHIAVYEASHNPLFPQLLAQLRETSETFWDKPFDRPDFARRSFPYHRELFDAVVARDAEGARRKIHAILDIVEEDIKEMSK